MALNMSYGLRSYHIPPPPPTLDHTAMMTDPRCRRQCRLRPARPQARPAAAVPWAPASEWPRCPKRNAQCHSFSQGMERDRERESQRKTHRDSMSGYQSVARLTASHNVCVLEVKDNPLRHFSDRFLAFHKRGTGKRKRPPWYQRRRRLLPAVVSPPIAGRGDELQQKLHTGELEEDLGRLPVEPRRAVLDQKLHHLHHLLAGVGASLGNIQVTMGTDFQNLSVLIINAIVPCIQHPSAE